MKRLIRAIKTITLSLFAIALLVGMGVGYGRINPHVIREVVEVPRQERDLKTLIKEVPPQYGVPPLLAAAIVQKESGGRRDAIRFEPGQMERAKKVVGNVSQDQLRQYASSHCAFQVMGYHAPKYGLSWADLYNPETCAEVAMTILSDCIKRHASKDKFEKFRHALGCYNGSMAYADDVMGKLGEMLIEETL